jgi:hypothetical protein
MYRKISGLTDVLIWLGETAAGGDPALLAKSFHHPINSKISPSYYPQYKQTAVFLIYRMKVDKRMMQSLDVPEIIEFTWSSSVGKLLEHSAEKELLSRRWTDLSIQQGFKLIESPYRQSVEHEEDDKDGKDDQSIEEECSHELNLSGNSKYQKKHRALRRHRKKMQDIEIQMLQLETKLTQTLHVTHHRIKKSPQSR